MLVLEIKYAKGYATTRQIQVAQKANARESVNTSTVPSLNSLEKLEKEAQRKAELRERMRNLNRKNKDKKKKILKMGDVIPPQTLSISVQTPLTTITEQPEEQPEIKESQNTVSTEMQKTVVRKYASARKALFAAPAKRKIARGCDFVRRKKK